jgi:hypothetical protein
MEGNQSRGQALREVRWNSPGGKESVEHPVGWQSTHQRCPFNRDAFSLDAIAIGSLDDGYQVQIDAVGEASVEPYLVEARLVSTGQAGVIDERERNRPLDLNDPIPSEKDPGDVGLDQLDRLRLPWICLGSHQVIDDVPALHAASVSLSSNLLIDTWPR